MPLPVDASVSCRKQIRQNFLVEQAISQLQTTSAALAALKQEMQSLAASLPEYPVVMEMFGVALHSSPNS